ncbi:MAG: hypothetical protein IJV05_11465 [Muribaculaceae bacterium]|nr:hypothetical protein [Muribaculaceae bacterium]
MRNIIFILLASLLALAACDDNGKDEPGGGKSPRIYLEIYTTGGYYIYDTHGKLIFECPQGYGVTQLTGDGKNWYGVLQSNSDSIYRILKNGKVVITTPNEIKSLAVENGDIYTLQWDKYPDFKYSGHYTARICKNERQLYESDSEELFIYGLSVDHGDLIARAYYNGHYGTPTYWLNGKIYSLPIQVSRDFTPVEEIIKNGKDTLAFIGNGNYQSPYWWLNGEAHQLPQDFGFNNVYSYHRPKIAIAGGIPYMAGYRSSGLVLMVNGQEYPLNAPTGNMIIEVQRHGNDVYTLTGSYFSDLPPNGNTSIFKGTEPVEIDGRISGKDVRLSGNDSVNLNQFSAYDFVVLNK